MNRVKSDKKSVVEHFNSFGSRSRSINSTLTHSQRSAMQSVEIAKQFCSRLVNRDKLQGDGKCSGELFRTQFLQELDSLAWWKDPDTSITLDFSEIETLGPSWANEVFAYFTKFDQSPSKILSKIRLLNISRVKRSTIEMEINAGYSRV